MSCSSGHVWPPAETFLPVNKAVVIAACCAWLLIAVHVGHAVVGCRQCLPAQCTVVTRWPGIWQAVVRAGWQLILRAAVDRTVQPACPAA